MAIPEEEVVVHRASADSGWAVGLIPVRLMEDAQLIEKQRNSRSSNRGRNSNNSSAGGGSPCGKSHPVQMGVGVYDPRRETMESPVSTWLDG